MENKLSFHFHGYDLRSAWVNTRLARCAKVYTILKITSVDELFHFIIKSEPKLLQGVYSYTRVTCLV